MMTVKELRDNLNQLVNRHYETSEMARFYSFPMTVGYVRREIFIKNPRQQELSVPDQDVPAAEAQRERLAGLTEGRGEAADCRRNLRLEGFLTQN
jgi:hypothetical protein